MTRTTARRGTSALRRCAAMIRVFRTNPPRLNRPIPIILNHPRPRPIKGPRSKFNSPNQGRIINWRPSGSNVSRRCPSATTQMHQLPTGKTLWVTRRSRLLRRRKSCPKNHPQKPFPTFVSTVRPSFQRRPRTVITTLFLRPSARPMRRTRCSRAR